MTDRPGARRRLLRLVAALVTLSLAASGCQFSGVHDLPLPGGVDVGDDAYEVEIAFRDVLDLVPQSAVKVNDVSVGRVEDVRLEGWHAVVTVSLKEDVRLPDNAVARLRQTSLLGEKFVSLSPPSGEERRGRLSDGDVIPLDATGRNPEVEEVLSALSLLLNGGGVQQIQTINRELTKVMEGREDDIRSVLDELDTFVGGLDEHRAEIVRAIEGLDRLSARLERQRGTLRTALQDIPPGVKVLANQREELTRMLEALSELGEVGTRVIEKSKEDTLANLRALQPTLAKLAEAGHDLPRALELLVTYPFPSTVGNAVRGDYTNLRITADLDLQNVLGNLDIPPRQQPSPGTPPEEPDVPDAPTLPGLEDLPDTVSPRDVVENLCEDVPEKTGLPKVCTSTNLSLPKKKLPDVVSGLCSLVPEKRRDDQVCPEKTKDADDDGDADVCLVGLICTDEDARKSDGDGSGGGSDDGDPDGDSGDDGGGLLCPPLCVSGPSLAERAPGADEDVTRLLLGGLQ